MPTAIVHLPAGLIHEELRQEFLQAVRVTVSQNMSCHDYDGLELALTPDTVHVEAHEYDPALAVAFQ
jgi:hypothetical protein